MTDMQPDWAFFHNAVLDTIVPKASNASLPEALEDVVEEETDEVPSLLSVRQRDRLFFGEQVWNPTGAIISYSFTDQQMND
jgi:hypothetical protein